MTAPQLDDDKLQRYFDGELPEAEADEVRHALEASEQEQAKLEQLGRLRDLIRMTAEDASGDVGSDQLFERVQQGIQSDERRGFAKGLRVVEGGRQTRRRVATAVGTAVALAAAVLLAVLEPWAGGQPVAERSASVESPETVGAVQRTPRGSEVVEVDFGSNTGTVFEVEGDSPGERIAVVWIQEEGMP